MFTNISPWASWLQIAPGGGSAAVDPSDGGLTLREIAADIPHDAAAVVVYLLLGFSIWLVWWGHRHSGPRRGSVPPAPADPDPWPRDSEDGDR